MAKKKQIDFNKIIGNNPNINQQELADGLNSIGDLNKHGVNTGPDYNLGSPYTRPVPEESSEYSESTITLRNNL
jgi:hypothetical protein